MIKRSKPTKNGQIKLTFSVPADHAAGGVSLVGDFNGWDPYAHPMQRRNGTYQVSLTVPSERPIRFRYLADGGVWFDDADADHCDEHGCQLNPRGHEDSSTAPSPA
ncbi:isoamylase early set domain-containing protein [Streptosporangium sp. NPDC048047]|uniref:isoamylase early set domain-containing protein n=1 Tax=unclassified Streptosporangium TaxID=2632669 RepID=UPI003434C21D